MRPGDALPSRTPGACLLRSRAWQSEGLTQQDIADELTECGAPIPSEYTGAQHSPSHSGKAWSATQVRRVLAWGIEARSV